MRAVRVAQRGRAVTLLAEAPAQESVVAAYGLDGFPFPLVVLALFVIVLCRAQGTYWVGRGVAAGVTRSERVRRLSEGPAMVRAIALLHRWGPIAVTLSFFTVGLQTVVNAAAGLVRMPWLRYTLFMLPGCVAWALIYATVGLGVFLAVVAAAAGSPWGVAGVVAILAAIAVLVVLRRRSRARDALAEAAPAQGSAAAE